MDITTFWDIIETAHNNCGGDLDEQEELLHKALVELPEDEIIAFEVIFQEMYHRANRADLWDAANLIRCYCTEGCFMDFRPWLITRGRIIFEKALEDPDSLVDLFDVTFRDDPTFGQLGSVAHYAYREKTGEDIPRSVYKPSELVGEIHDSEETPALFPRLAAKLGDCETWWENYLKEAPDDPTLNDQP